MIATSSRDSSKARQAILDAGKDGEDRLSALAMNITDEGSVEKAAKEVESRFGKGKLRLMINVAGVVRVELLVYVFIFRD